MRELYLQSKIVIGKLMTTLSSVNSSFHRKSEIAFDVIAKCELTLKKQSLQVTIHTTFTGNNEIV